MIWMVESWWRTEQEAVGEKAALLGTVHRAGCLWEVACLL